jgi:hypothetical protein
MLATFAECFFDSRNLRVGVSLFWMLLFVLRVQATISCSSLPVDGLLVDSAPSSSCLMGSVQGTILYNRSQMGSSLDDDVFDIQLPFPFRWFDVLYDGSVFVGSNSYITFGGSKMVSDSFNVFNPPFPSVLIGATDMTMQLLTVGRVPNGWLVRYEGALLTPDFNDEVDPNSGNFLSSSTMVWELLFFGSSGLQLCTGILNHELANSISAVSHQKSSAFAQTFNLQPNFQYKFVTTCAARNRVSLSTPIASVSCIHLNVMLFATLQNPSDVSKWIITLRGAGFSCPLNASVSLISSPTQLSTFGNATILNTNSSSPVLVISAVTGTLNGSFIHSFSVFGVSTPYKPQRGFSDLNFAACDRNGRIVSRGSNVHMEAILPPLSLNQMPRLQLSVPVIKQSRAVLQIVVSPKEHDIIFHQYATQSIVITVSGAGWWFDSSSVVVDADRDWIAVTSSIIGLETNTCVIRIDFDSQKASVISSITTLVLRVSPITTPLSMQESLSNIKFAILNACDSILASGNSGTLDAIVASTMGSSAPSISFSTSLKSVHDAVLDIKLTPTFRVDFQDARNLILPSTGPAIVVSLSGMGLRCSEDTPVTFLLPFHASGVATIDSRDHMSPVLLVTILSGVFESGWPIWFQVAPISTPSFEQPFFSNITSVIYGDDDSGNTAAISSSTSGTIQRIVGGMGPDQPSIRHTIANDSGYIFASLTLSVMIPANSKIFITLAGVAMTCSDFTPVAFVSPTFHAEGSASFFNDPFMSVLAVTIPGQISAGSNVSFSLFPVFASFSLSLTLNNVRASVTDANDGVLAASVSGVFKTAMSHSPTVKHYIISAINGTVILPAEVLAGSSNCNNVINETMPFRELGSPVAFKSSGNRTVIDCSSTNMRCLIVYRSTISVTSVTFKGGSSPRFMLHSTLMSIRALYDEVSGVRFQSESSASSSFRSTGATVASDVASIVKENTMNRRNLSKFAHKESSNTKSRAIDAEEKRQMFQSTAFVSEMFTTEEDDCGGCLLIVAADHSVSLFGVTFLGCSAVYGGGGFVNASSFSAANGFALNNIAQQGGGLFVLSVIDSTLHTFTFVNNTVATFLPSQYETTSGWLLGKFSRLPDSSAAAGGGAWFQLLNIAENCTFVDNIAIAAGTSDTEWENNAMKGAHALGSGLFVVKTRGAYLADLVFMRSQQLCAGWCVSAGALFVGESDKGTVMERFTFKQLTSYAVSSKWTTSRCVDTHCIGPSVVLGSCVVVVGMSITSLNDIYVQNVQIVAVGSVCGGCISVLQNFLNSSAKNISVSNVGMVSVGSSQSAIYGIFAAKSMDNSSLSLFIARNITATCTGRYESEVLLSRGIYGGVLYSKNSAQVHVSEIEATDIRLQSSSSIFGGVICFEASFSSIIVRISALNVYLTISKPGIFADCYGGVLYFGNSFNSRVSNSVNNNINLRCSAAAKSARECRVKGGVLIIRSTSQSDVFSELSAENVTMFCDGRSCLTTGGVLDINIMTGSSIYQLSSIHGSVTCLGVSCRAGGLVLSSNLEATLSSISGVKSENSTITCTGASCYCAGGLVFAASFARTSTAISDNTCINITSSVSGIHSIGVSVACSGKNCFVLGGIVYIETSFCLTIQNVLASKSQISSNGNSSMTAGAIIGIGASNSSIFSNIQSFQSTSFCGGSFCQSLGGAISILSGKVAIKDCLFSQSQVQCSGFRCASIGGFISAVSTLIYNSDYKTQIDVDSSVFRHGSVSCSGFGCFASGGALTTAKSYRSSIWLGKSIPELSESSPPQISIFIRSSHFKNNSVTTMSTAASAGGGAISIRSAVATVINCTFEKNYIHSSHVIAFAGGGGLHIFSPSSQITIQDCSFSFNDASDIGQGGAILAAFGATLLASNLVINDNYAGKGGGISIDASEVDISNSQFQQNAAATSGGGLFCSSNEVIGLNDIKGLSGMSHIKLQNVSFHSNEIVGPQAMFGVGGDVFVIGSVIFAADSSSEVSMSGSFERDITATVVSVITNSSSIFLKTTCLSGTMLRVAPTSLSNQLSLSEPPTLQSMIESKCFPACLEIPTFKSYVAASGFFASCTPCPRGTFALKASNSTSDNVASFCLACPFGADCLGGNMVRAQDSYWGWKVSDVTLPKEFVLLPEGYGCQAKECQEIDSCGQNHSSVLCGGCNPSHSAAFFTTACVSDDFCATWKLWVLVSLAFLFALCYSIFLRYDSNTQNTQMMQKKMMRGDNGQRTKRLSEAIVKQEKRSGVFYVLMWYYQLVGLLLSMPSPLQYFDGNALVLNIIGLIFGTAPVSQVFQFPSFVFCTAKGSAQTDILLMNFLFYLLWAIILAALSFDCVWLPIFRALHSILNMAPTFWSNYEQACAAMALWGTVGSVLAFFLALKWTAQGLSWATFRLGAYRYFVAFVYRVKSTLSWLVSIMSCKTIVCGSQTLPPSNHVLSNRPTVHPCEVRGRAWLDFGVTSYSALLSLMIQCTTCITLPGYRDQGNDLRWYYDGRVACFSDAGELPGRWQIAALVAVIMLTVLPLFLSIYMSRASMKPIILRNIFETSALPAYSEQFNSANMHWLTVM